MSDTFETIFAPEGMAAPRGHYSHAARGGGLVFVSGQLPVAADGTVLHDAPFETQAKQVLANVSAALRGAGSSVDRLLHMRVYITDITLWPAVNEMYVQWTGGARPARAVVPVPTCTMAAVLKSRPSPHSSSSQALVVGRNGDE